MGIWSTYCCLCGGPPGFDLFWWNHEIAKQWEFKRLKNKNWLKSFGAITPNSKYVFGKYDVAGDIDVGSYIMNIDPIAYDPNMRKSIKNGFLVHKKCYILAKHINNLYDKLMSFTRNSRMSGYLVGLDYKPLNKYAQQFFEWDKFIKNPKDHYALEDPSFNAQNKKRIMKNVHIVDKKKINFKKIETAQKSRSRSPRGPRGPRGPSRKRTPRKSKSRSKSGRKSPSISATSLPVGTIKTGNDGHKWKIKKYSHGIQRWVKI